MGAPPEITKPEPPRLLLRLYVAGNAPNSLRARENLTAICRQYLDGGYRLEVVDALQEPQRALADGILVTPTLLKLAPPPVVQILGNLSARAEVLSALNLSEEEG